MTAQPTVSTLHIPTTHTFVPFQQFSFTDGPGIRNPSDDNNNKTAVHVVSVVAAVSGLCPAKSLVSMQPASAQIAQAMVTPTMIPTMVAPMTVQAANCLAPSTTVTVANTISISNHLSVTTPQNQASANPGINLSTVTNPGIKLSQQTNCSSNNTATSCHQNTPLSAEAKPTTSNTSGKINLASSNGSNTAKPNTSTPKTSSSNQSISSEQSDDLVKPVFRDGELILEVECGQNKAVLYLSKLCQGSKGPCISFQNSWLTPNEFQFVSGRETAKDWKRSIRHHGKSLKLLLAKGILNVHPTMCDCDGCRQGATLTRKGEKRRVPNGERKPRKPNSANGTGGSMDGSATRPANGSLVTTYLLPPGGAQVKSEPKRCPSEKSKILVTAPQGLPAEINVPALKQMQSNKSTSPAPGQDSFSASRDHTKHGTTSSASSGPAQRPDSFSASRDHAKHGAYSSTSSSSPSVSPQLPRQAIAANTSPLILPRASSSSVLASTSTSSLSSSSSSSSMPSTPIGLAHPLHLAMPVSSSPESSPLAVPILTPSFTASKPAQNSPVTKTNMPSTATVAQVSTTHTPKPANLQNPQSDTTKSLKEANSTQDDGIFNQNLEYSNEEHENNDREADKEVRNDNKSETKINYEQLEETSGNNESSSEDQIVPEVLRDKVDQSEPDAVLAPEDITDIDQADHEPEICDKEEGGIVDKNYQNSPESNESPTSVHDLSESLIQTVESPTSLSAASSIPGTLALSSARSSPLSLSVSTTNIKSEQIWVPPVLSPHHDSNNSIHHSQPRHDLLPQTSPHAVASKDTIKPKEERNSCADKNEDRTISETQDPLDIKQETTLSSVTPTSEGFPKGDRNPPQETQNRDAVSKRDYSHVNPACISPSASQVKCESAREREERQRQKIKEERFRKEKEERNRKDKERDERREKEKKDEIERRRQEEVGRHQGENKVNKDGTSVTSDPARRPPGGVAEAAAFSDYMRVLAAGHAHSFMPPTPSYMSSLFPIRPQDPHLPTHLLHTMTPFVPQLSGIPKDPLLYQTTVGVMPNYGALPFGPLHTMLQRPYYTTQQSVLDYQRSLVAAASSSSYPWHAVYPYFHHDVTAASSSSTPAVATGGAGGGGGVKRASTEMEAAMEVNAKRMRLESRPSEYTSPWDYFAAVSQHMRVPTMVPTLPCGMESASVDKTAEFLRKRYLEYGPQAAAYLSALPDYARSAYSCVCADHRDEDIRMWNVEEVCKFLSSLEGCAVYTDHFREQRVTGRILAMLTTDHLVKTMGMKLGPALLLCEAVSKKVKDISKLVNCEACRSIALSHPVNPMVLQL